MKNNTENIIRNLACEKKEYLVNTRRFLHSHPEKSRQEFNTALFIEAQLDSMGIPHKRIGETGVLGIIKASGKSDKKILLRADIDALPIEDEKTCAYRSQTPGTGHLCGHDAHTTCLLGAADIINKMKPCGDVLLMFQQAEEIGYGARVFIENGVLDGVTRVFGLHTAPDVPVGCIGIKPGANNASVDYLKVTVKGKGAHISTPELGADALLTAARISAGAQDVLKNAGLPEGESILLGIGKMSAGAAYNSIAENAVIEGTLRAYSQESREKVIDEFTRFACEQACANKCTAEVYREDFTSPLINDPAICKEASDVAEALFGSGCVVKDRALSYGGDDFAELNMRVPGVYAYLGTANKALPDTLSSHHNGHFDIDEDALPIGTALLAAYACDYLGINQTV